MIETRDFRELNSKISELIRRADIKSDERVFMVISNVLDRAVVDCMDDWESIKNLFISACRDIEEDEFYVEAEIPKYKCQCCGKYISNEEGITTVEGAWVCDADTCRTLDDDNEAYAILWELKL